jgi:predicted component of type VI protein secretion system
MKLWLTVLCVVSLMGCASSSADKQTKPAPSVPARTTASNKSNPLAKYIELVGVRANEKSPGHLQVQFGVVNHSEADIGDVKLDVSLGTTAAKAGDPPLITFSTKVPALGPNEMKQVSVDVPTKLRVYELPDWQFLKADFQIGDLQ